MNETTTTKRKYTKKVKPEVPVKRKYTKKIKDTLLSGMEVPPVITAAIPEQNVIPNVSREKTTASITCVAEYEDLLARYNYFKNYYDNNINKPKQGICKITIRYDHLSAKYTPVCFNSYKLAYATGSLTISEDLIKILQDIGIYCEIKEC